MGRAVLISVIAGLLGCTSGVQGNPDANWEIPIVSSGCGTFGGYAAGQGYCGDAGVAAVCTDAGLFRAVQCRGATGCTTPAGGGFLCDRSTGTQEGDGCLDPDNGKAVCSDDAGTALTCSDGGFHGRQCDAGCSASGGSIYCL